MATKNRIREYRTRMGISQHELGQKLPDSPGKSIVSLIENGHVLPTVGAMQTLCDTFICTPTDLYREDDLNVTLSEQFPDFSDVPRSCKNRGSGHDGMTEFRVWVKPEEKAALETAVEKLGYRNPTEWFREAYRSLMREYRNVITPSDPN